MKIRMTDVWHTEFCSMETALENEMTGYSERGELEQLVADVEAIRRFVAKFAARYITSAEELNGLVGYQKYEKVKELE